MVVPETTTVPDGDEVEQHHPVDAVAGLLGVDTRQVDGSCCCDGEDLVAVSVGTADKVAADGSVPVALGSDRDVVSVLLLPFDDLDNEGVAAAGVVAVRARVSET